jgi:putative transposase
VYIIGRFEPTTSKCSSCQTRHKISLKDRTFICPCCSLIIDRDLNAAINIKAAGRVVRGAANKLEAVQT